MSHATAAADYLAFSALIFAHRALGVREFLARTAADIVFLPLAPFELLVCPDENSGIGRGKP